MESFFSNVAGLTRFYRAHLQECYVQMSKNVREQRQFI